MYTPDAIKNMTPEEVRRANKVLGRRILAHFALVFGIKWLLIIAINKYGQTFRNSLKDN